MTNDTPPRPPEREIVTNLNVTGARRHALAERGQDLYETAPEAVRALLAAEDVPAVVWEPACGPGAIVRVLRDSGRTVVATDLVDYASPYQDAAGRDFLLEREVPAAVECILTNPPFKIASEFAAHALRLCPRVILLARLAFLESARRSAILDGGQLARVLVFKNRLPMMHRAGWKGPRATSTTAYAWFVWNREHRGDATIRRVAWRSDALAMRSVRA
jgi:hypothetical protein